MDYDNNRKFCVNCGRPILKSTRFCPYCGVKQPVKYSRVNSRPRYERIHNNLYNFVHNVYEYFINHKRVSFILLAILIIFVIPLAIHVRSDSAVNKFQSQAPKYIWTLSDSHTGNDLNVISEYNIENDSKNPGLVFNTSNHYMAAGDSDSQARSDSRRIKHRFHSRHAIQSMVDSSLDVLTMYSYKQVGNGLVLNIDASFNDDENEGSFHPKIFLSDFKKLPNDEGYKVHYKITKASDSDTNNGGSGTAFLSVKSSLNQAS